MVPLLGSWHECVGLDTQGAATGCGVSLSHLFEACKGLRSSASSTLTEKPLHHECGGFVNFQLMLAHFLEVRQDEQHARLQTYQVNKPCLLPTWSG